MTLWVPPKVARDLREETLAHNEATLGMFDFLNPVCKDWNEELKKLDPYLCLGKAREKAFAVGVIPGFWHLVRINPGAPLLTMPIYDMAYFRKTGNYKYAEPTSAMLDQLRSRDMQNMRVVRDRMKEIEDWEQGQKKARADRLERLVDEGEERYAAYTKVRIPFNTGSWKWSQNHAGQRGRRVKRPEDAYIGDGRSPHVANR